MPSNPELTALDGRRYVALTTFKRDGTAVATPVWFAVDGGAIVVITGATTGKVKRLRNDGRVTVAPCDGRGKPKGPARSGTATILPDAGEARVRQLIKRKYGIQYAAITGVASLVRAVRRRPKEAAVGLEVTLDG